MTGCTRNSAFILATFRRRATVLSPLNTESRYRKSGSLPRASGSSLTGSAALLSGSAHGINRGPWAASLCAEDAGGC